MQKIKHYLCSYIFRNTENHVPKRQILLFRLSDLKNKKKKIRITSISSNLPRELMQSLEWLTAASLNQSSVFHQVLQSDYRYVVRGQDVVKLLTNHHTALALQTTPLAQWRRVRSFLHIGLAAWAQVMFILFRMSYFEGKPVGPAPAGCSVSRIKRTRRRWLAAGLKNVNGKEKSVYQTKRVMIKTTEQHKNHRAKVEFTFWRWY